MSEKIQWAINQMPKSDDAHLGIMSLDNVSKARAFHKSFPQYSVTPLARLDGQAARLGLGNLCVKDESYRFGLNAFKLFKSKKMALFFIFSGLLGMSLQVTNGYATPFITHFKADPALADTFAANNATLLVSISQIAEAFCILLIPFFLKRYGIKNVMMIAMFAWVLRFGFFGLGGPAFPGVTLFILSCLVYGVAFDFFNVSGGLFVDAACSEDVKASAQGLFMLMTNGLGATIGTLLAGEIVNHYCTWENGFLVGDWQTCWFIFAGFALAVGVSFALLFKHEEK